MTFSIESNGVNDIVDNNQLFKVDGFKIAILGEIININSLNKEDKFSYKRQEEFFLQFYKKYGFEKLHLLKGHFLIVLFEEQKQKIFIATDHFGSFPFYYSKRSEERRVVRECICGMSTEY